MDFYERLITFLPTEDQIIAECVAETATEAEADRHAIGKFRAFYRVARSELADLIGKMHRAEPPDDDHDDDSTVDCGGEGHIEAAIYDDPEACDVGRTPCLARDVTRHDLRGATV